jgi:hypothetical protein
MWSCGMDTRLKTCLLAHRQNLDSTGDSTGNTTMITFADASSGIVRDKVTSARARRGTMASWPLTVKV